MVYGTFPSKCKTPFGKVGKIKFQRLHRLSLKPHGESTSLIYSLSLPGMAGRWERKLSTFRKYRGKHLGTAES